MNPFAKLNLADGASPTAVRARWQELRSVHHPDHGGDATVFHELQQAFTEAYALASAPRVCQHCGGTGRTDVRRGFNVVQLVCELCQGAGQEAPRE